MFVFFMLTVAAAESAIGLAILVVLFRERRSINVEELDTLQGLRRAHEPERCCSPFRCCRCSPRCVAGLGGRLIGRAGARSGHHRLAVAVSCVLSLRGAASRCCWDGVPAYNGAGLHLAGQRRRAHAGRLPDRPADAR